MFLVRSRKDGDAVARPPGSGSSLNPSGRFERHAREAVDDGWGSLEELADDPSPATHVLPDRARSIIARNQSPDVPFEQSINPYRGCEHGCEVHF